MTSNVKVFLEFLLFMLALAIFATLTANHAADWRLIAVYWLSVTAKNAIDFFVKKKANKEI